MEERELLTFLISVTILLIALFQHRKLYLFPALKLPILAFCLLVLSNLANLLDNTHSFAIFSLLEHFLYALSAIAFGFWIVRIRQKSSS